jgi:hypothetical protein
VLGRAPERVGDYPVTRRLGAGGMGVVYEGVDPTTGRPVALKVIEAARASPAALARFLREAEVLGQVRHPGVVAVHAMGQADGRPFLVLDLLDGPTLARTLEAGPLEPWRAARIARDLADALAAVHAAGVIHRDVKPANIVLVQDAAGERPVLLDFGVARHAGSDRLTNTGDIIGTPAYMAPEQATGTSVVDARCDVYALGGVLYSMLVGRPPFHGVGGPVQTLAAILHAEPRWPRALGVRVPPPLEALLVRAMKRDPNRRPQSAGALRDELEELLRVGSSPRRLARTAALGSAGLVMAAAAVAMTAVIAAGEPARTGAVPAPERAGPATEPPAVEPLWQLAPGTTLDYTLSSTNGEGDRRFTIAVDLRLKLEPGADEAVAVRLAGQVLAIRAELAPGRSAKAGAELLRGDYDSRRHDPEHPLAPFFVAVGRPIGLRLERRDGAVQGLTGFDALQAPLLAADRGLIDQAQGSSGSFRHLVSVAFDDLTLGRVVDDLCRVRGPNRRIPWRATDEPGRFTASARQPALAAQGSTARNDQVELRGRARYAGGRLVEAWITEESVVPEVRGARDMRWSLALATATDQPAPR